LIEASGGDVEPEADQSQSAHGEVIGSVDDMPEAKRKKKGLEVSFINGQIVLDRSTLVVIVDLYYIEPSSRSF
jgi:hypothetical protein